MYDNQSMFCSLECSVLICDFHREQAWERWLTKSANGCRGIKDDVLAKLRRIARSLSIDASEKAIDALKSSIYWKDKRMQVWWSTVKDTGSP